MTPLIDAPLKILLADDDPEEVELLTTGLKILNLQFNLVQATNHTELFAALASSSPFDLIIIDIAMPGINGIDCLLQLKKDPVYASIPVIIMTVSKEAETIQRAYEAGAHYFVVKPYSQRNYIDTLTHIFSVDWKSRPSVPPKNEFVINLAFA